MGIVAAGGRQTEVRNELRETSFNRQLFQDLSSESRIHLSRKVDFSQIPSAPALHRCLSFSLSLSLSLSEVLDLLSRFALWLFPLKS